MKKIIVITSILLLVASSSFAAITSGATGNMNLTDSVGLTLYGAPTGVTASSSTAQIGKTSTGVSVGWATNVNGYALVTQHKSGTKAYGTSYDSTALFQYTAEGTPGTVILAKPAATDTTSFTGTNWKAM